jgi:hypothetical protein
MRRTLLLAAALTLPAWPGSAQTVDEIVAKNLAARGGAERIRAVKSLRMTSRIAIAPGVEAPAVLEMKRPGRLRLDLKLPEFTASQVYDGAHGWQTQPSRSGPRPQPMSEEELANAADRADIDGPLLDYKEKGHALELLGRESVDGADAFKLRLTLKNGHEQMVFIDAVSFLEVKGESSRTVQGTRIVNEQRISDYRDVAGLRLPFRFENGIKGRPGRQSVAVERIEVDPEIDDTRFAMPAVDGDSGTGESP